MKQEILLSAACAVSTTALALLLASCDSFQSPTAPRRDCAQETGCTSTAVIRLAQSEELSAIERARASVERDLGKPITTARPRVDYVACPFNVPNSNFGDVCANGATYWREGYVQVATWKPDNVSRLVEWEARNYFLCANGACEKAV
jgi:hypothetical protein